MTIRSRLLILLLPMMIAFVTLISGFFYLNWYNEIISSFKSHLQTIVISSAQAMDPQKILWIDQHLNDPDLEKSELYQRYYQKLNRLRSKMPIKNLYVIKIESTQKEIHQNVNVNSGSLASVSANDQKEINEEGNPNYRQIYLLDAGGLHRPGENAYNEIYKSGIPNTKESFVSPIYESINGYHRLITGYAPILDSKGYAIAFVAADLNLKLIDQKLQNAIIIVFLSAILTIFLVIISVYFIANKISKPVQKIKNAALAIAAGDYTENIEVKGPHEIVELANTLNTMSECLQENMNRLQESSLVRERMHGEYECSLLLQHYMSEQVIQNFNNPRLLLRGINSKATTKPYGLLLKLKENRNNETHIEFLESKTAGFLGIFDLLLHSSEAHFPRLTVEFNEECSEFTYKTIEMPRPIVWKASDGAFAGAFADQNQTGTKIPLKEGDLIFLYNQGIAKFFDSHQHIQDWFNKVLKHFATEDYDLLITMLKNELTFLVMKHHIDHDMYILCIKTF